MDRSALLEAYARRLVAALSADLGTHVASVQRTTLEEQKTHVVEWKALLENGAEVRLSAVVHLASDSLGAPAELSRAELEELRDLGISPEDAEGNAARSAAPQAPRSQS
jgi:hypothetical protein